MMSGLYRTCVDAHQNSSRMHVPCVQLHDSAALCGEE